MHELVKCNWETMAAQGGWFYEADQVDELVKKLETEIEELKRSKQWVSVKDRLPTRDDANEIGKVLGYLEGYGIAHEYSWTDVRDKLYGITHWMPMPKFSKSAKNLKSETKLVFNNVSRERLTFLRDKMNEALSREPKFNEFTWEIFVEGRPEITEV